MRNVWTIFKKEIYRVVSDKRLVITIFLVPGLTIYLMYSILGNVIQDQITSVDEHRTIIQQVNMPNEFKTLFETQYSVDIQPLTLTTDEAINDAIMDGRVDVILRFDSDFEIAIETMNTVPQIEVFFNQSRQNSSMGFSRVLSVVNQYREIKVIDRLSDPNDYFVFNVHSENIMDESVATGQGVAMLLPMLVVIFLFAGAMSIGPDAIAGEKERGTIATLLITPIKRRDIALGKVLSLAVLSFASALSSFIGVLFSLPTLLQLDGDQANMGIYGFQEYVAILLVLMSTVLFIVGIIAVISAYAKTIKEASMLIMPLYFIAIIVGILNSFSTDTHTDLWIHFVPIYGSINLLSNIFMFNWQMLHLIVIIVTSVIYTGIFVMILNRMFQSEKIMFKK